MAAPRWPIVVGIAALGGGLAWCAARGEEAASPPASTAPVDPRGSAIGAPAGAGQAAIRAPAGPSLGSGSGHPFGGDPVPSIEAPPIDAGPSPQQLAFGAQTRDPAWAGTTETEIKRRLGKLDGARLVAAECRRDQCELTIGGSQEELSAALGVIESPRGLRDYARSVLLTAPEQRDGRLIVRAYAQFER